MMLFHLPIKLMWSPLLYPLFTDGVTEIKPVKKLLETSKSRALSPRSINTFFSSGEGVVGPTSQSTSDTAPYQ